jgi:hypothetical protein
MHGRTIQVSIVSASVLTHTSPDFLVDFARRVECQEIHSMSTSESGYKSRLADTLDVIRSLRQPQAWTEESSTDFDEAHEFASSMKGFARSWKRTSSS